MRIFTLFCLLLTLVQLTGCTSKAKKECKGANWSYVGQQDGELGRENRSRYHYQKCNRYKVFVSTAEYEQGYLQGIERFCNFERGLNQSIKGLRPEVICAEQTKYTDGYESGLTEVCNTKKGKEDALSGKKFSSFCIKKSDYQIGYKNGQLLFCSHRNGYRQGYEGRDVLNVCKGSDFYDNFAKGFNEGKLEFLKKENLKLESDIKGFQSNLNYIKTTLDKKITQVQSLPKSDDSYIVQMKSQLETSIKNLKTKKDKMEKLILQSESKINLNNQQIGELN